MPPSHHSSSHHSSSHRSSHSSSHHSSSRSRSSSHSSHSSSHSSYSYSARSRTPHIPRVRERRHQPVGYMSGGGRTVSRYHMQSHDYDYYPVSWTAPDGRRFEKGYYDEEGNYYRNVFVPGTTLLLSCTYCGNQMLYSCKEGELPCCSNCGAQFQIDIMDRQPEAREDSAASVRRSAKIAVVLLIIFMAMTFGSCALFVMVGTAITIFGDSPSRTVTTETASRKNSVYVEEIGRTCYLDGEDWYDSETKCWFWFNDEETPYQWQYWYEDISSDYWDYGWMEYSSDEDTWYVEVQDGQWVVLPEIYDTSSLWHFTDEYTDPFAEE